MPVQEKSFHFKFPVAVSLGQVVPHEPSRLAEGGYLDMHLPIVSAQDAPVVLRTTLPGKVVEHRAFDGGLLAVSGGDKPLGVEELSIVPLPTGRHRAGVGSTKSMPASHFKWTRRAEFGNESWHGGEVEVVDGMDGRPDFTMAIQRAMQGFAGAIIVDGIVWRPSTGPVVYATHDRKHAGHDPHAGLMRWFGDELDMSDIGVDRSRLFSALEPEAVFDAFKAEYRNFRSETGSVEVLSEAGWDRRSAVEAFLAEAVKDAARSVFFGWNGESRTAMIPHDIEQYVEVRTLHDELEGFDRDKVLALMAETRQLVPMIQNDPRPNWHGERLPKGRARRALASLDAIERTIMAMDLTLDRMSML